MSERQEGGTEKNKNNRDRGDAFMPKIIWCGNKSWDTDFPENTLPNNAKRIERPDNIFKSSLLYGILPLIFSYAIICIKWFMIGEKAMNPIYVPFGIILGLLLLPVH